MENLLKKHAEKLRFAVVGGLNTAIDFVILFTLVALGFPNIAGNYISTSVALIFSFFANKKFTFKHDGKANIKQLAYFLLITIFGLWVIQPVIIEGIRLLIGSWLTNNYIVLLIGKILANATTLIWNYLLYRKFVFKKIEK